MALLGLTLLGHRKGNMKDIIVKIGCTYKSTIMGQDGGELEVIKSLDELLPIDRVVTIDSNNLISLYDICVKIEENMIEREL